MAQPTATIKAFHPPGTGASKSFEQGNNYGPWTLEVSDARPMTGKTIKIYNVLGITHKDINRAHPYSKVTIPACKEGQRVSDPFLIPPFVNQPYVEMGKYEQKFRVVNGMEVAIDIINPALTPSWRLANCQDIQMSENSWEASSNVNNNLNEFGVFATTLDRDDPALEPLIEKFKARAEKTLSRLYNQAKELEISGKSREIGNLMRFAAGYFGLPIAGSQIYEHKISCPNCGEPIKAGIFYHRNQFGEKCVLDWKKTVAAGAAKKEDVPDEFRWWEEKKKAS